jgi:hypothetical protein
MKKPARIATRVALAAVVVLVGAGVLVYGAMKAVMAPRYEPGAQVGAAFCGTCHPDQYRAWSLRSRHALATRGDTFLDWRQKVRDNRVLNVMMGERMCHACHGPASSTEGVSCEVCHGRAPEGMAIAEAHRTKFTPGLARMREAAFCGKCHEMPGTDVMSVYTEWRASDAAAQGITCQDCHMKRGADGAADHGFDSAVRDVSIYAGYVAVTDVSLDFPELHLIAENRVTGHAVPAEGPTRYLVLRVDLLDGDGGMVFSTVRAFGKKARIMAGLMPWKLTEDTGLKSGERRPLAIDLPESTRGRVSRAVIALRFCEIAAEHNGDLDRAHWISEPFFRAEVPL